MLGECCCFGLPLQMMTAAAMMSVFKRFLHLVRIAISARMKVILLRLRHFDRFAIDDKGFPLLEGTNETPGASWPKRAKIPKREGLGFA